MKELVGSLALVAVLAGCHSAVDRGQQRQQPVPGTGAAERPPQAAPPPPALPSAPGVYIETPNGPARADGQPLRASESFSFLINLNPPPARSELKVRFWPSAGGLAFASGAVSHDDGVEAPGRDSLNLSGRDSDVYAPVATPIQPGMFRVRYEGPAPRPGPYLLYYFTDDSAAGARQWTRAKFELGAQLRLE